MPDDSPDERSNRWKRWLAEFADSPLPRCVHCGRVTGDMAGGWATVNQQPLCHPNDKDRPDCYHLHTTRPWAHVLRFCHLCTPPENQDVLVPETALNDILHRSWEDPLTTRELAALPRPPALPVGIDPSQRWFWLRDVFTFGRERAMLHPERKGFY
jgi:hypothetical protein